MGIRIQPREIDIPDDQPFKNDLLDRRNKAEVLTNLVNNVDGPCTMAVDAAWGAGKTTFLKMWEQHLRNEGFPVVEFNAWETDASGEPFVALTTEITEQLKVWTDSSVASRIHQTQFLAKNLLRRVAPGAIRTASGFIPVFGAEVGHVLSSYASEAMAGYLEEKQSAEKFRASLQQLANSLRETSGDRPTVILIDELDRCRPSYAIELLETAKHIFGVDNVVFVLAVNREELAHSVKALYGSEFGANGYLGRFFDIDFRLPAPNRQAFIQNMLSGVGVYQFFEETSDRFAREQGKDVCEILILFLSRSDLSLRSIGQTLHRFAVVLSSLGSSKNLHLPTLTVLSTLSAVDPSLYRKFVDGGSTAEEALESVFEQSNFEPLRQTTQGAIFEAVIIAARLARPVFHLRGEEMEREAPLLGTYARMLEGAQLGQATNHTDVNRARIIYDWARKYFTTLHQEAILRYHSTNQFNASNYCPPI